MKCHMVASAVVVITATACTTRGGDFADVKRIGQSTYEITTHAVGLLPSAPTDVAALNDDVASRYCAGLGSVMTIVDRKAYGGLAKQDVLTFKCNRAGKPSGTPAGPKTAA
jgi:hypothetical protein